MAKIVQTYTLFIAAPGDITTEKNIIHELADQWNRLIGRSQQVRIDVTDWGDTYPVYGKRPQAIINEQIFDYCDIVVALFWTKFGAPTGVADSGTEEEILRAITLRKHLLLYFNNSPIAPDKFSAAEYQKVEAFKERHQNNSLYRTYTSEDDFKKLFQSNLAGFMSDLIGGRLETKEGDDELPTADIHDKEEIDETGVSYGPLRDIESKIKNNFTAYWAKLYGIFDPKSSISEYIKVTKDTKQEVKQLKAKVADWEKQIRSYSEKLNEVLLDIDDLSADELQNDILPEELWTVGAALSSRDSELWWFKQSYQKTEPYKIKSAVKNIIGLASRYSGSPPDLVKKNNVNEPASLGFDLLKPGETLLIGAIGKGIRSEILHKLSPQYFSLMTRRSVWALFFLSDEADEFIVDQTKDGKWRTVHNWDYLYDRFTYFNHVIFGLIKQNLAKQKIEIDPNLKFGYVNLFLVDVFKSHGKEIEELRRLKKVENG